MNKSKKRKAPNESATKYSIGTQKRGNNGNTWTIIRTKKGIHRWKKLDNTYLKVSYNVVKGHENDTWWYKKNMYGWDHLGSMSHPTWNRTELFIGPKDRQKKIKDYLKSYFIKLRKKGIIQSFKIYE